VKSRYGDTASCDDVDRRDRIGSAGSPRLCESYCFGTLDWEVTEEGELTIWGYDDFEVYEARENGLPDYEGGIVTHEFLRELADTTSKLTKSSTSKRPGIRSVDSRSSQSGTSFATAKSSTLTSVPRADRRVALFIPGRGAGRSSRGSSYEVIVQWATAHLLRTNVQTDSTRSTTASGGSSEPEAQAPNLC